ncbi:MAG: alanine-glyoxylate transaminase/serine-glyoxylate transaminase/serine-pyruvate transaminase [Myxococcota bacterium]|jgi:alanine-glyoxylate transaminase/serine-glyoxylate transaminase/serine-pyruvate transaminase
MARPLLGHLDPLFIELLDEVKGRLRTVFGTANPFTLPLSATGSAGMEACLVNLLERGDEIVVGVNGVFGGRMCDVAARAGAKVERVDAPFGEPLDIAAMAEAIRRVRPKVVAFVHAETSTGVLQSVPEIAAVAAEVGSLLVLDCVTSLAGVPVSLDEWGVDAAYSGTQKCLSCPPSLSPVSFSDRAIEHVRKRKTPVQSWYFDVSLLAGYYEGEKRVYHHTAPISSIYGLSAGLALVEEEGLNAREKRHREAATALIAGVEPLGFKPLVAAEHRLPMLTSLVLPENVLAHGEANLRSALLNNHNIEVGAGLGALAGKIWRVGLMGENARTESVDRLVEALRCELAPH